MMVRIWQDVRFGFRMLRKTPVLTVTAILTFGLGIALTTTIFSIVNGVFYKGLPFEDGSRIVMLWGTNPARDLLDLPINARDFELFAGRMSALEGLGYFKMFPMNVALEPGQPERFAGARISINALNILRVQPAIGRGFRRGEGLPGAVPVVLIGNTVWRDRFGASPDVLGRIIRVDGIERTIIGVMPGNFRFPAFENLWIPFELDPAAPGSDNSALAFGRLRRAVNIRAAREQARIVAAELEKAYPDTNSGISATLRPFSENFLRPPLYLFLYTMLGAGVAVLLIACVNVTNLLLARFAARTREFAVRIAVGASRSRIHAQVFAEALLLAAAGGLLGFWWSVLAVRWFAGVLVELNPPPFWMTFDVDHRVLAFVAAVTLAAGLFAGMGPARQSGRRNAGQELHDEARSSKGLRSARFSSTLTVCEIAASCALLIASGLMIESLVELKRTRMPFAVDQVFTARIALPKARYEDNPSCLRFYRELLPKLESIPGVEAAMLCDSLPATGNTSSGIEVQGMQSSPDRLQVARTGIVTPGFFHGFQARILQGREFSEFDQTGTLPVAVVNESFVRRFFPDGTPVGRSIRKVRAGSTGPWTTIVGVVPDFTMEGIGNTNRASAGFYVPLLQSEIGSYVSIALRTREDAVRLTAAVRSAVASLSPDLPVYDAVSMRTVIQRQSWFYTLFGTLFLALGAASLFMALAGLYAVMSFSVAQRTRELGIRAALGARENELVRLVIGRGMRQLLLGLLLGVGLGMMIIKPLQGTLYRLDGNIPVLVAVVLAALSISGLIANLLPARRVTRIDPVSALSVE